MRLACAATFSSRSFFASHALLCETATPSATAQAKGETMRKGSIAVLISTRGGGFRRQFRCALGVAVAALALLAANASLAQQPDLGRAEQLVKEGKYQDAYDLLAPF